MRFNAIILIFIAITIGFLIIMWSNLNHAIESLAKNQIKETTEKVESKLNTYFHSIRTQLLQVKELTDNGRMYATFDTDMNYLLFPIFNTSPQINTFLCFSDLKIL